MFDVISILIIAAAYVIGYIVSLYASAVYVDPDELETLLPSATESQRTFLTKLSDDPRSLMQISEAHKSFTLLVISVLSVGVLSGLAAKVEVNRFFLYPAGLIIVWFLYVAIVEILPRQSSRKAITPKMLKRLWVIRSVYAVFSPILYLYRVVIKRAASDEKVTEEEKEEILERAIETVAEHAGIGERIVDDEEKAMIGQIFLLDQTVVREIMIPRIDMVGIEENMSFRKIRQLVSKDGHSRYPVYQETIDKVIGLIYVKDLFSNPPEAGEKFDINRYLRKPYFVPETKIIGELLREFKDKRQHIALVADEYGGVAGLVTLEDIIEEIFGEIQDEHDSEDAEFADMGDGRYVVSANLLVEKLQDYLDTEYEQADYDTVGGLIYDLVGSVPSEGQKIRWNDLEFEVDRVEGQRIVQVTVRRKAPAS